jgi:plastocyanin
MLIALVAAACSGGTASEPEAGPEPADASSPTVVVTDMAYEPASLTVEVGETVTWLFDDGAVRHDVAGDGFQSDIMAAGSFSHRFDAPGTYAYVCTLHPNMTGTIEVVPD